MNYHQKLEAAINAVLRLSLNEDDNFFLNDVVPNLQVVRDLLFFPNIDNCEFKKYLALFQDDVQIDINRCVCISSESTTDLMELLQSIKSHIKPKLQVVDYAFGYYLNDSKQLFEQLNESKAVKFKAKPKAISISISSIGD